METIARVYQLSAVGPLGRITPNDYFLIGEVNSVTNILNMLALVALLVSGFLVMNVVNSIVVEQKRQIGVMKSLGAVALGIRSPSMRVWHSCTAS